MLENFIATNLFFSMLSFQMQIIEEINFGGQLIRTKLQTFFMNFKSKL